MNCVLLFLALNQLVLVDIVDFFGTSLLARRSMAFWDIIVNRDLGLSG
jgi:hypothetical protein